MTRKALDDSWGGELDGSCSRQIYSRGRRELRVSLAYFNGTGFVDTPVTDRLQNPSSDTASSPGVERTQLFVYQLDISQRHVW